MNIFHASLFCLAVAAAWAAPLVQAQPAPARPPIESFFENPAFGGALLSPSARYLAARSSVKGGRDVLMVIDLEANTAKAVAAYNDADIYQFQWVNDDRLVYNVRHKGEAQGDVMYGPGLFAVNRDGSNRLQLAKRRGQDFVVEGGSLLRNKEVLPWHTFLLGQRGPQDSEFIYVRSPVYNTGGQVDTVNLLRLNTLTGRAHSVARPGTVQQWLLDHRGEPRLAIGAAGGTTTIFYADPASGAWRALTRFDTYAGGKDAFRPLGFGPDGTLYVVANGGDDTASLRTFDFATGKVSKDALVVTKGYDFAGRLIANRSKLLGLRLSTDAEAHVWFDPAMKAVQQAVDSVLPATANLISVPAQPDSPWVLVEAYSDTRPARYMLFHPKTGKLNPVGEAYPDIKPEQMGRQEPVRYKARDGLEIPGLLTLPPGVAPRNLPLVVLVHGGPWVRGATWGWDRETQFLASRGYAVLEPAFRGTLGYGNAHVVASWKQWGLAMQDDIADGARWAIAQGYADPKRICIAGGSYGGYSALMGLVNDPDLYKCGINWAGVTDINLLYDDTWLQSSDLSDQYKKHGMPRLIGDQVADAAQLKATSPLQQAARITQPLLLAYGGADRRVPIFHGRKFYDAVKPFNRHVEWIEYPEEGHGWVMPKNRIDFWSRVEKFLDKHIGKP